ncbi:Glycine N-acyltransferase-like protein 3, partial [Ophiophagus hannah]
MLSFCSTLTISLHLGTLSPSDAPLVNDTWPFASNGRSLRYLRSLIEDFPNACLLDQKGQLVAWSLSDALGRMTHGYALPEYQGKGHMKTVLQAIGRKDVLGHWGIHNYSLRLARFGGWCKATIFSGSANAVPAADLRLLWVIKGLCS